MNANVVHAGDTVTGAVTTSSNVASVVVSVLNYTTSMTKTGAGTFIVSIAVPNVPPMFRRTYPVEIIARNARGDQTTRTTSLTIQ